MYRRMTAAALTAGLALVSLAAAPALATPDRRAKPIVLASPTPAIDAGGVAAFAATGLPAGPAVLQMLDPSSKKWVKKGTFVKRGTSGAVSISGVPQGVTTFRAVAAKRTSNVVAIKAYGIYTFGGYTKQHTFGTATMAATQGYFSTTYKNFKVPGGAGCDIADMGLQMESPQPSWRTTMVLTSASGVAQVEITALPSEIATSSKTGVPVSGAIDIGINSSTSNGQAYFGWTGIQFHCLADPGISTIQ